MTRDFVIDSVHWPKSTKKLYFQNLLYFGSQCKQFLICLSHILCNENPPEVSIEFEENKLYSEITINLIPVVFESNLLIIIKQPDTHLVGKYSRAYIFSTSYVPRSDIQYDNNSSTTVTIWFSLLKAFMAHILHYKLHITFTYLAYGPTISKQLSYI